MSCYYNSILLDGPNCKLYTLNKFILILKNKNLLDISGSYPILISVKIIGIKILTIFPKDLIQGGSNLCDITK